MIEKVISSNIYKSKALGKTLKFVSENSAIYTAGTSLAFASIVRPISTLLTPKTNKDDKKLSCVKSISSAVSGFLFTSILSTPFSKAIKNVDNNPKEFLTNETIKNLTKNSQNISSSKSYRLITQLFKLGLGFLIAYPKAMTNNAIIPLVINKISKNDDKKEPSFSGKLENIVANTINNSNIQKFANKMQDTKYTTHLIASGDVASTLAFTTITSKNKKLNNHQKKVLNLNAIISTALCVLSGYGIDKLTDKHMQKFIENLKKYYKNSPDLSKYIEGGKIIKTSVIFGMIYYCFIPIISTFLSSKIADKNCPKAKDNL